VRTWRRRVGKSRALGGHRVAPAHRVQQEIEVLVARPRRRAHDERRLRAREAERVEEPPAPGSPGLGRQWGESLGRPVTEHGDGLNAPARLQISPECLRHGQVGVGAPAERRLERARERDERMAGSERQREDRPAQVVPVHHQARAAQPGGGERHQEGRDRRRILHQDHVGLA
jgi:hypothetical protein